MTTYVFVSPDEVEIQALKAHFMTRTLPVSFSSVVPMIKIAGLDAIVTNIVAYESMGGT